MQEILELIKKVRGISKKRKFVQTFDLIVNIRGVDLKKPENRFSEIIELPYGKGKEVKMVIFSDMAKDIDAKVIKGKEIEEMAKNKREIKKLVKNIDFFFAEPQLMPLIGRFLGKFLAPRNKMPIIIREDLKALIERYKKCVRINLKTSPIVQCAVGTENMKDEEIVENILAVINFLKERLPKGENNIGKIYLKLTMGKPVEVDLLGKRRKG
jgi:large subunit ribosomal protein L1